MRWSRRLRIEHKVKAAASVFFAILVVCLFATGLAIERLGAGDLATGAMLGLGGLSGIAIAFAMRYGENGIYNPSRIHRREKAR